MKIKSSSTLLFILKSGIFAISLCLFSNVAALAQDDDKEQLGKAVDYFQGEKYHEALLIFQRLDKHYRLNPRYKAYIGLCYYKEWEYEYAREYLDSVLNTIGIFSPEEQSTYYFADAESHFNLKEYAPAVSAYEKMLTVCHDNEKADALYRLGLCYMEDSNWIVAEEYLESAEAYYGRYGTTEDKKPRMKQIKNMIAGCRKLINKESR